MRILEGISKTIDYQFGYLKSVSSGHTDIWNEEYRQRSIVFDASEIEILLQTEYCCIGDIYTEVPEGQL